MTQKTFEKEPTETPVEQLMEEVRDRFSDLDLRIKRSTEVVDDSAAGVRLEMSQFKREMGETRVIMARLQSRVDNQLLALVLANIASGVGVAALILGATSL